MSRGWLSLARRTSWLLLAAVAVAAELLSAKLVVAAPAQTSPQFEALPLVRSHQNHLLVHAFINGKPAWMCVDSGAPVSAIAVQRRGHFRLSDVPDSSKLPPRLQINGAFNNVAIAHHLRL